MSNVLSLIKVSFINNLNINKFAKRFDKNGKIGIGLLFAIVYFVITIFITLYLLIFQMALTDSGASKDTIILIALLFSSVLVLFNTIGQTNALIFKTKDYEFLVALPIKRRTIILSKMLTLYLIEMVMSFPLMIAALVDYTIFNGFDGILILYYLLVMVFIPMFPLCVGGIFSFAFGFIPINQKVKNLLTTIISLAFVGGFMALYFNAMSDSSNIAGFYMVVKDHYFIINFIQMGLSNILYFLIFLAISLGSGSLFVLIGSLGLKRINNVSLNKKKNYSIKDEKYNVSKGLFSTLFKRELKLYASVPAYIVNTAIGPILAIAGVVLLVVNKTQVLDIITTVFESDTTDIPALALFAIFNFTVVMAPTTSASISVEGKCFWHLLVFPVNIKQVFFSKVLINLLITIPAIIIGVLVGGITFGVNWLEMILLLFSLIAVAISISIIGLLFNLLKPKFDYDSPVKAIKQGMAVLFTMLVGMAMAFFLNGVAGVSMFFLDGTFVFLITLVISSIILVVSILLLNNAGPKLFKKINM